MHCLVGLKKLEAKPRVFTPKEYTAATCLNGFKISYKDQLILTLTGGFSKDNVTALTTAHANQELDMTKSDKVSTGSRGLWGAKCIFII